MSDIDEGIQIDGDYMENNLNRIRELRDLYEYNWGQKLQIPTYPPDIDQELMIKILERIVETGESLLVGYNKIREQQRKEK